MASKDFTAGQVKQAFGIQTTEGKPFFLTIVPVASSYLLVEVLDEAMGTKFSGLVLS